MTSLKSRSNTKNNLFRTATNFQGEERDDEACWDALKKGDEAAFIQIYQRYFKKLFIYGSQFTLNEDLIQDCIQDLFIDIRKNRKTISHTNSVKKYLFKALKHKIVYHLNREKSLLERHRKAEFFEMELSIEQHIIDRQLTEEKVIKLRQAIEKIPMRQREAIYYFYYENMTYQEVADIMNLSHIKSARNLIYQALRLLKNNLIIDLSVVGILLMYF